MNSAISSPPPSFYTRTIATARHLAYVLSRLLLYVSFLALIILIVWYSRELYLHGHSTELIAWFSAGAFVILGFPISMYGIFGHLSNYYQPTVQCYVVRILWMVPIYSIESWLCLRFHENALYIETLRDVYESYVIYCFFHYLIAVLGGEDALVLMLKDKSPTRGFHLSGLGCCLDPWLMGQPVSRAGGNVTWTSPFFLNCKFGILQYVLLKVLTAVVSMVLELNGLYHEGSGAWDDSYIYITVIANFSQCWALYCLAFFYFATKNELAHIRPVGKFLCVKALIFFTWWQAVGISILNSMGMIPEHAEWSAEDVGKGIQVRPSRERGNVSLSETGAGERSRRLSSLTSPRTAPYLPCLLSPPPQDYLICIEMFIGAIVHQYVFHHSDYCSGSVTYKPHHAFRRRRVGRRHQDGFTLLGGKNLSDASLGSSDDNFQSDDDLLGEEEGMDFQMIEVKEKKPVTIMEALIQSSVPSDVMGDTKKVFKGDFKTQKTTLLHHSMTADSNSLFTSRSHGSATQRMPTILSNEGSFGEGESRSPKFK